MKTGQTLILLLAAVVYALAKPFRLPSRADLRSDPELREIIDDVPPQSRGGRKINLDEFSQETPFGGFETRRRTNNNRNTNNYRRRPSQENPLNILNQGQGNAPLPDLTGLLNQMRPEDLQKLVAQMLSERNGGNPLRGLTGLVGNKGNRNGGLGGVLGGVLNGGGNGGLLGNMGSLLNGGGRGGGLFSLQRRR